VYYEDPAQLRLLDGLDVWEFNDREAGFVLALVDEVEWSHLAETGLRHEIDEAWTAKVHEPRPFVPAQAAGIPGFPCYRTVEETFATAAQLAADHPDLATWSDFGDSWEKAQSLGGHDLNVLRLTSSAVPGPKPKLVVTASIHAREYTPAELVTRFAEYLVGQYDVDADATWLLDYHEIHLVLQANPDGRKQAETGKLWRKNTNKNYCGPTSDDRGADLNRNFSFEWGCCGGSSGAQCSETYRGPSPASEPETQSIQSYVLAELPDQRDDPLSAPAPADATGVYLDVHSFSQLVLWPWGFSQPAPNHPQLRTLGRKFAFFNDYTPQQAVDLYTTDGTTIDFAYGELGVAAFVFELGTWFFEDCATFEDQILPDNLAALLYAAKVARTPYLTPAGPDTLQVQALPVLVDVGTPLSLSGVVDDTRYENGNGVEPSQAVAAAEYTIDVPPWDARAEPGALAASDGAFDEPVEAVSASVDTTGLPGGRHTLFVRGRDANGSWGAVSATFFIVTGGPQGTVGGTVVDEASDAPLAATVAVDLIGASTSTQPASGAYSLTLPAGVWTLRASAPGYHDQVADDLHVSDAGVTLQDFALAQIDDDGDGVGNLTDCDPEDPEVWSLPSPARQLAVKRFSLNDLTWQAPNVPGAFDFAYDVLRSSSATGFDAALCLDPNGLDTVATDGSSPAPGAVFYYLVRTENRCGGNLGTDSAGTPRTGKDCS
jgi:hypothetical protein